MKKIVLICSFLFLLAGCSSDESSKFNESAVQYSLIAQNDFSVSTTESFIESKLVIKDIKSWTTFLATINGQSQLTATFTETEIDFTKYQIIDVFDEIRHYGGYSVDITRIVENGNKIVIQVEHLKKGNIATVVTHPFHIIKMPRSNKKVIFKEIKT
ncbi:MAG: protease complex subunit PrcB family protein [Flavobacterium circumlabens]|uniref:protease complex subunit PrcB family protein n=1 Tax=Flavobacterium circumlabens TaxID=2133765 RepID=UPI0032648387